MGKGWRCVCSFVVVFVVSICLGSSYALAMSVKEEVELGRKSAESLERYYGVLPDDDLQERVDRIGQRLAAQSGRKGLKYTFKVLNTEEINAVSLPGGYVYLFRGLVDFMPTDAELAGVIGHEIGHIVRRHAISQMKQERNLALLTLAAALATGKPEAAIAGTTVSAALMGEYSRQDERESDAEGLRMCLAAGFNPYSTYVGMAKLVDLAKAEDKDGKKREGGLFDSHPQPEERLERILKALAPHKIVPTVQEGKDGSATVVDGAWQYTFPAPLSGEKARYRAYLMAGALYLIKKESPIDRTRFVAYDEELYSDIYYGERHIVRLYGEDAVGCESISEYARKVIATLQKWGDEGRGLRVKGRGERGVTRGTRGYEG